MDGPTPEDLDRSKPGWYLGLAAPRVKPPPFAWIDPSRIYIFQEALQEMVEDLVRPFDSDEINLVAGIDAMGFILGAAIAQKLGKGFLALRKAGHLCVETVQEDYVDYQKRTKSMEVRTNPFKSGTRVLVVDQWIETGGTMKAATSLVEKYGGIVVGIAAIAIESSPGGKELCSKYKSSSGDFTSGVQEQLDKQYLDTFKLFKATN